MVLLPTINLPLEVQYLYNFKQVMRPVTKADINAKTKKSDVVTLLVCKQAASQGSV